MWDDVSKERLILVRRCWETIYYDLPCSAPTIINNAGLNWDPRSVKAKTLLFVRALAFKAYIWKIYGIGQQSNIVYAFSCITCYSSCYHEKVILNWLLIMVPPTDHSDTGLDHDRDIKIHNNQTLFRTLLLLLKIFELVLAENIWYTRNSAGSIEYFWDTL